MSKLLKYAEKSQLSKIKIILGDEEYKFNLYEELKVDEELINEEIESQPRIYSFLSLIYDKLDYIVKLERLQLEKHGEKILDNYKGKINPNTGRAYSKEYLSGVLSKNNGYLIKSKKLIKLELQRNNIKTCLISFQQRKDLIQTLSANRRKEQL